MSQGAFGNLCDNNNYGDPIVLYDSFEDRWIITDFAFSTDTSGNVTSDVYQCFAVSRTGDPVSGGWYFYSDVTSDALPDYPKFGVWAEHGLPRDERGGDTCTVTGSGTSYSAANVTQACAVTATFAINQYAVTASVAGGNGTITPPSQQVSHGGTASFTVTPAAGYHTVLPIGGSCGAGTLAGTTYTIAAVTGLCTVSVAFERNPPHHLAFAAPLADVARGNRLGAVQVAIVDEQGVVIATDSTSQITLTTQACGAPVTLGQATASNGVATFPAGTSARFFTLANGRTIQAGSGSLGGSATVDVLPNADLPFADDFELCRL